MLYLNQISNDIMTVFEIMMEYLKIFANVYIQSMQNLKEN